MMYAFMTLDDGTEIVHSEMKDDGRVKVYIEKPDYKVTEYVESNHYGKFELEPLERGFGTTIGNALRRAMLSSLPGDAITSVKIDGVDHEFQKMDGVIEDVTAIILNLKSVVLKNHSDDENKIIRLSNLCCVQNKDSLRFSKGFIST